MDAESSIERRSVLSQAACRGAGQTRASAIAAPSSFRTRPAAAAAPNTCTCPYCESRCVMARAHGRRNARRYFISAITPARKVLPSSPCFSVEREDAETTGCRRAGCPAHTYHVGVDACVKRVENAALGAGSFELVPSTCRLRPGTPGTAARGARTRFHFDARYMTPMCRRCGRALRP